MRASAIFLSLSGLLFSFFLLFAGIFFLLLPCFPQAWMAYRAALSDTFFVSSCGLFLIGLGALLLIALAMMHRRRYLLVKMGGSRRLLIKSDVFQKIALKCLQETFPHQKVDCDVIIKRRKEVCVIADLPFVVVEQRGAILEQIEEGLEQAFANLCGYTKEFLLNVQFSS